MKNVYLLGDCQSLRLYGYHDHSNKFIDFKMWAQGTANASLWYFDPERYKRENLISQAAEKVMFHNPTIIREPIGFSEITDDGLILSWLGYQDIKFFLPEHDNAERIAKRYIKDIRKSFPNSSLLVAEPLPQFKELFTAENTKHSHSYEDRLIQNDKFCKGLQEACAEYGIETITQKDMMKFMGLEYLDKSHIENIHDGPDTDRLDSQYWKKLHALFMKRIYDKLMKESMEK